jgi:ABC-type glycerol-3-phosphate transport system substrate-binding protein
MATDPLALESWRRSWGAAALAVEPGSPYTFNNPEAVKAFTFLRKLLDEHCAWNARSQQGTYPYFAQRNALFISATLADLPDLQRAMENQKSQDRWTILPYPAEKGSATVLVNGASQAILQGSPASQLAAWLFYRYLNLARVQARLAADASLIPARISAIAEMDAYRQSHGQWAQVLNWERSYQPLPKQASWRLARRMLQDAAWQILQPFTKLEEIPTILAELDQMANGSQ